MPGPTLADGAVYTVASAFSVVQGTKTLLASGVVSQRAAQDRMHHMHEHAGGPGSVLGRENVPTYFLGLVCKQEIGWRAVCGCDWMCTAKSYTERALALTHRTQLWLVAHTSRCLCQGP